jgi:hypothetical protein
LHQGELAALKRREKRRGLRFETAPGVDMGHGPFRELTQGRLRI